MPRTGRSRLPAWILGSGVIAIAMAVMNLSTYGFTIIAARLLGPREYGGLAAVMGLLLVVNVVSLGLQATGARRVSAAPKDLEHIEAELLGTSYRSALALGLVCLLAVPAVTWLLRLDSWWPAALLAATAVPLTVMGGQAGIIQGERRWLALATIYLAVGLGRVVLGVAGLALRPDTVGAMAGVAFGAFGPVVVGWLALRRKSRAGERSRPRSPRTRRLGWSPGGVLREVGHNSHALLAFFALSNADVVIARVVLDDQQSGLYAGGLILAKAVLFLPQFVVVLAFPAMSAVGAGRGMHLKGLALVLGIGTLATAGTWLLSGLAVTFIGGDAYAALQPMLWVFATVGTLLAMIQLMVYSVVARQRQRAVFVVWGALLTLLAVSPLVSSVTFLLVSVVTVEASLLIVLVLVSLHGLPGRVSADDPVLGA